MIELAREGRSALLTLTGPLDFHGVADLEAALDGIEADDLDRVVVELEKGGVFDDGAVGVLVRAGARLRSAGARLVLVGTDGRTREALRAIGVDRTVVLAESRDEALAS